MPSRPNVLLIVIDQFRADLLEGTLAKSARLKNLTALADNACIFRQHYTVVSPCGPSRVSLFTGQYAMNHRAVRNGTPLRHDTPNLAREMCAAGYDPLLFGYTDVAQDPRALPADDPRLTSYEEVLPGFTEVVRQRMETDDEAWRDHLRAKGYAVPDGMALYIPNEDRIDAPAQYRAEDSDTAFLTDRFLDHMSGQEPGWFATLTYIRPHPPLVAPAPYNALFDPSKMPSPLGSADPKTHPYHEAAALARPASSTVEGFPYLDDTPETVATLRALYLGLAAEVDHHIGRVVAWLKKSGQWEDTLLIVTADHGEMLGDYGLWGKSSYHDAAFHVPLIMHVPGISAKRIDDMTETVDIAPTVLDFVGHPVPDSMNGISLLDLAASGHGGKNVTLSEHDFGNPISPTQTQRALGLSAEESNFAVLRTDTHRLVHFAADLPQVLFDMTADGEMRNIAATPVGRDICLDLSQKMLCHRMTNPESTFARTLVADGGVRRGAS